MSYQATIARIDRWLLRAPVVCPKSGAVAGVTSNDQPLYWYGEIAGYYLSYLAGLLNEESWSVADTRRITGQVSDWLKCQWQGGPPQTRVYSQPVEDWRNQYVFSFDLAMQLRGIASATNAALPIWNGQVIVEYLQSELIDEGGRLRALLGDGNSPAPATWSTRVGGYQLKSLSGLLAWGREHSDQTMVDFAQAAAEQLLGPNTADSRALPPHPRLYALEGALLCDGEATMSLGETLEQIYADIELDTERTDVLAQLLRLAIIVGLSERVLDSLGAQLLTRIDTNGGVVFRHRRFAEQRNTWCALFTRQALDFLDRFKSGRPIPIQQLI